MAELLGASEGVGARIAGREGDAGNFDGDGLCGAGYRVCIAV